jgi:acyl carrier protein
VSFSSVNGFLGGYGVSAYAAANAFLESFSEYQRAFTPLKAYCVSWSLWDDVGMSRGYAMKEAAQGRGFHAISARQGLASLLAILHRPPSHTCVGLDSGNLHVRQLTDDLPLPAQGLFALANGDSGAIARLDQRGPEIAVPDGYGTPTRCHVRPASQETIDTVRAEREQGLLFSGARAALAGEPVNPEGELERTIAGIWREVLEVEQLGVTDNFFDLGGSSLTMGQINHRLQEVLKRKISMTEMFQYATVRLLSAYLSGSDRAGRTAELGKSQSRGDRRREMARARRRG